MRFRVSGASFAATSTGFTDSFEFGNSHTWPRCIGCDVGRSESFVFCRRRAVIN